MHGLCLSSPLFAQNMTTMMGNHKHDKACRKEEGIREPPDLPLDILHDIFARTDPITIVRCDAASKLLRRHITADPSFHQHLRNHHAKGFVPALLVGMFFADAYEGRKFVPLPSSSKLTLSLAGDDDYNMFNFKPVASRAGLVVLSRYRVDYSYWRTMEVELCVCSPLTGDYVFLPPATVLRTSFSHVVLTRDEEEDDAACRSSFRLLALDASSRTQTFSSRTGKWGPVTEPFAHLNLRYGSVIARCSAVVLRGVAHWLYGYGDVMRPRSSMGYAVLASTVAGTGQATAIEIPRHCLRWRRDEVTEELLLARSAEGRLALLVAESLGIAMWTLSEDSTSWTRRLVVDRQRILGSLKLHCHPLECVGTQLDWFGEASGTVAFQMHGVGILLLNLQTREISQISQQDRQHIHSSLCFFPYEIDLVSVLAAMKSF